MHFYFGLMWLSLPIPGVAEKKITLQNVPRVVPLFPLPGQTPSGLFMGLIRKLIVRWRHFKPVPWVSEIVLSKLAHFLDFSIHEHNHKTR